MLKGKSPKEIMGTEMHKFESGNLHSGAKKGPVVKSRKQAIAIGLDEAGKARRRPGLGGPDPMERSVAGPDVALPHRVAGAHYDDGFLKYAPEAAKNADRAPRKEGPAPGVLSAGSCHGYGHDATQRQGHLRNSGDSRAHRIGRK